MTVMTHALKPIVQGFLNAAVLAFSTPIGVGLMVVPALLKLLLPIEAVRRVCDRVLTLLASAWVRTNNAWIASANPAAWDVQGLEGLSPRGWYLVSCNHQTWVDILVLQRIFHRRIPFLKFFLKRELMWVPVIGLAWWALDFPFMKRGKGIGSQQRDLDTTRQACLKFKRIPTAVINFVEGTRCTEAKRLSQRSPYRHLLKPKIGGLGIALATMGETFEALLDVTIVYPLGVPTFADLLCGRVGAVTVRVQAREIPADLLGGDLLADPRYRQRLGAWAEQQWIEKDALIEGLLAARAPGAASAASPAVDSPARTT
jgi:1-acyl-sn-glycerol-3-phosphate acyltransferase